MLAGFQRCMDETWDLALWQMEMDQWVLEQGEEPG